jgi:hypothetical protein
VTRLTRPLLRHASVGIVLVLVSSVVSIYAIEAFLSWDPLELRGPPARPGFDRRGAFAVVEALRRRGLPAVPVLANPWWSESPPMVDGEPVFPLAGVPRATTVLCNETGSYVTYTSDRFGFNNPDPQWEVPITVALVGDSYVEGWCVEREESFGGLIRQEIPGALNVGFSGHGPLAELGTLRECLAPRRPAHVVWFFYTGNDLTVDLPREWQSDILRRYLEPGFRQHLPERAAVLGDEMRRVFDVSLASWKPPVQPSRLAAIATLPLLSDLLHRATSAGAVLSPGALLLDEFRLVLAEAKRTVEEWGGTLRVVYLPDLPSAIGEDALDHDPVLAVIRALRFDIIDLLPDFRNHPAPLSLFPYEEGRHLVKTPGVHYGRNGHRLVADRVLARLRLRPASM